MTRHRNGRYIYTENHATRTTGISLLHPIYYADGAAEIDVAYAATTSYLFGSTMLVAPIVQPIAPGSQTVAETTWLPPGEWVAFSGADAWSSPDHTGINVTAQYVHLNLKIVILKLKRMASRDVATHQQVPLGWSVAFNVRDSC